MNINLKKILYDFTTKVTKEVEVETKRVEGDKEITEKTKEKKLSDVKIVFCKPNRNQKEECDLDYHAYFFKCMDSGLYTKQQLHKVYKDKGGDLCKGDLDYYIELQTRIIKKIEELDKIRLQDSSTLSELEKEANNKALAEYNSLRRELIDFESARSSIFDKTADTKAFHRQVLWYKLNLFYKEVDSKWESLFTGKDFAEKAEKYDELLESNDELLANIDGRITAYVTYWIHTGAQKKGDFAPIDTELGIKL